MSNVGPVCHIPPANTPANPTPHDIPGMPGSINPGSPTFNQDVANMMNAFRQMLLNLLGQLDALKQRRDDNNGVTNNFKTNQDKTNNWEQVDEVKEKVKVYQNNDPTSSNWVEVERTNKLVMRDKSTGRTWIYNRHGQ